MNVWCIEIVIFDLEDTFTTFLAWTRSWTIVRVVFIFRSTMTSQLSMWANLLAMSITIFSKSMRSFLINIFVLRFSIKCISRVILTRACFSFLILEKNIETITYSSIRCLISSRSRIVINKVMIRIEMLDVCDLKNFLLTRMISKSIFRYVNSDSIYDDNDAFTRA